MYKARVVSAKGKQTGEQDLPESLFDGVIHEAAMWQSVKAYLANQRQGTSHTKTREHVSGGNKKPWRQKGTGRARQGSIRSPQWRGGGSVFGPRKERNFHEDIPKKVRWLARRSAYNARAEDGAIVIVDSLQVETPRTQIVVKMLEAAGATGNVLLLTNDHSPVLYLSARNIQNVEVRQFGTESAYDLLWSDTVVIEGSALERANEVAHA
jgi:large subunit ribosomal protein L4